MDPTHLKTLNEISSSLRAQKLTLAVAESCTAGLLQNQFSLASEATGFFQGGLTVYNVAQKSRHLGVDPILAHQCNAVSREIAETMAHQVSTLFNASLGLSITGYAEPIPEQNISSCYAYIALVSRGKLLWSKRIRGKKKQDLKTNQELYVQKILKELQKAVTL